MTAFILSSLCLLGMTFFHQTERSFELHCFVTAMIVCTDGISCIVCTGAPETSCADPYAGATTYSKSGFSICYVSCLEDSPDFSLLFE